MEDEGLVGKGAMLRGVEFTRDWVNGCINISTAVNAVATAVTDGLAVRLVDRFDVFLDNCHGSAVVLAIVELL